MVQRKFNANDSLQQQSQSTREPSTMSGLHSFEGSSTLPGKKLRTGNAHIGGGSYASYLDEHKSRMTDDIEATTRKLELEQRRLYTCDKDLKDAEAEYAQKRQRFKHLSQPCQDDAVAQKQHEVRRLERQLSTAIADHNQGTLINQQLRQQIDQHRKERLLLDAVFKKQEKLIAQREKEMKKLVENRNKEKALCEDAKNKKAALSKVLDRDRKTFQKDVTRMKTNAEKQRDVQKEREQGWNGMTKSGLPYMVADEEEAFSFEAKQRQILKISFLNTCQRRHIQQHQKNIEVFEQAFATIKSTTGISNVDEIVKIFLGLEQRNFSLLSYVNMLNGEIEATDIRNRELKNQLDRYKQEQEAAKARKEVALQEVTAQISKTEAAAQEKEEMIKQAEKALDDCRGIIRGIMKSLDDFMRGLPKLMMDGYDSGELPSMRTNCPDEHEERINHHLMYIEEAINQFRVCLPKQGQTSNMPQPRPPQGRILKVDPPSSLQHDNDSDDDPESGLGDTPWLSRKELELRVKLQRKGKKKGQGGLLRAHAQDTGDEVQAEPSSATARRDAGPPPAKADYAASSVTSRESAGEGGSGNSGVALSKSPSVVRQSQAYGGGSVGAPGAGSEGVKESPLEDDGGREALWWREKNQKK